MYGDRAAETYLALRGTAKAQFKDIRDVSSSGQIAIPGDVRWSALCMWWEVWDGTMWRPTSIGE